MGRNKIFYISAYRLKSELSLKAEDQLCTYKNDRKYVRKKKQNIGS